MWEFLGIRSFLGTNSSNILPKCGDSWISAVFWDLIPSGCRDSWMSSISNDLIDSCNISSECEDSWISDVSYDLIISSEYRDSWILGVFCNLTAVIFALSVEFLDMRQFL